MIGGKKNFDRDFDIDPLKIFVQIKNLGRVIL